MIKITFKLRKNSKKKSSYASNKIEGNPLSEQQVDEVIESDDRRHLHKDPGGKIRGNPMGAGLDKIDI